jgi:hypothetical protein
MRNFRSSCAGLLTLTSLFRVICCLSLLTFLRLECIGQVFTTTADIGSVGATGSSSFSAGTYTINGAGAGITGTADAFRYTYKTQSGDCQVIARVSSVQNTNAAAKAAIMIRESTAVGSRHATLSVTPGSGVVFLSRGSTNGSTSTVTISGRTAPQWVKLIRTGTSFSGYISQDGIAWERIHSVTVSMGASATSGLAVTSNVSGTLCEGIVTDATATAGTVTDTQFPQPPSGLAVASQSDVTAVLTWSPATDDIGITSYDIYRNTVKIGSVAGTVQRYVDPTATPATMHTYTVRSIDAAAKNSADSSPLVVTTDANSLLAPWIHRDIGAIGIAGTALSAGGVTVKGSGADIAGTGDAFHFAYQTLAGDGEIIAKLNSITNTAAGAKAGVMIRESINADSKYAMMLVTSGSGASFIRRTSTGGSTSTTSGGGTIVAPHWVRLVRSGSTIYAFRSLDGVSWTAVGNSSITMTNPVLIGLAVTSQNIGARCDAVFQSETISGDSDGDGLPDRWENQYFGDLSQVAATDADGDGTTNLQELAAGTSPSDYYNGTLPTLAIISGNNQSAVPNAEFTNPIVVRATRSGTNLNNAPLTFTVLQGGGTLSTTSGGVGSAALNLRTASNGQTSAFCRAPGADDATNVIQVTATSGTQTTSVTFNLFSDSLARPGLQIWLRADRGITKDSLNRVATWADQSGNGRNATQGSANVKPVLESNVVNGRPVLRFDGGDSMSLPNFMGSFSAATVFIVHRVAVNASLVFNGLWELGSEMETSGYPEHNQHFEIRENFGTLFSNLYPIPAQSLYDFHVYSVNATTPVWRASVNGKVLYSNAENTVAFSIAPRLGRDRVNFFKGDIAEFLIYNRGLTAEEDAAVRKYLNFKYGLVAAAPNPPLQVSATAITNQSVAVEWKGDPGTWAVEYVVERRPGGGGSFVTVGTARDCNAFVDATMTSGSYVYRVSALRNGASSAYSNEAAVTVPASIAVPSLTGLGAWFRADLGVTTDGSRSVSNWADLTGNAFNAVQVAPAHQPRWYLDPITDEPAIESGSSQWMESPFLIPAETAEVFAVVRVDDVFEEGGGGPFGAISYVHVDSFQDWGVPLTIEPGTWELAAYPRNRLDKTHIYHIKTDALTWEQRVNGITILESPPGSGIAFGNKLSVASWFAGGVAELLFYNQHLTPAERDQVEAYLNGRYGIASVPAAPAARAFPVSPEQAYVCVDGVVDGDVSYIVERKPAAGAFAAIGTVHAANGYLDQGLAAGVTYTYRVKARSIAGESSYSPEVVVSTPASGAVLPAAEAMAWFRSDGGVGMDVGDEVRLWINHGNDGKIGGQNALERKPVLRGTALADRPVLTFDGTDDNLKLNGFSDAAEEGEFFMVVRTKASDLHKENLLRSGSGGFTRYPDASGVIWESFGRSDIAGISPGSAHLHHFNIYNVSAKTGEWVARLNNAVVLQETPFPGPVSLGGQIGGNPAGQFSDENCFAGDVAEVVMFPRVLTSAERMVVADYLKKKFALLDEDGDGMMDWWEMEQFGTLARNGLGDFDNDGLSDLNEFLEGLDARIADTDEDGLSDSFEVTHGLDGLRSNVLTDSDADGVPDREDADPSNPAVGRMVIQITAPTENSTLP